MSKKMIVLILLILSTMIVSACDNQKDEVSVESKNELTFMLPGESNSWDPGLTNETYSRVIINHLYEPLVIENAQGEIVSAAAESWTINEDYTVFQFMLRSNAKWSDGKDVTADDFYYALERILSPERLSDNNGLLAPFVKNALAYTQGRSDFDQVGIRVIDKLTLEIETETPTPFLLQVLSSASFSPLRQDVVMTDGWDKNPDICISNGPYVLNSYSQGKSVGLIKNEFYWDNTTIMTDKLSFVFRDKSDDVINLYETGVIDGLYEISISELRRLTESDTHVHSNVAPSTAFVIMDHNNPIFKDDRMRKALSIGIDRKEIVDDALFGSGISSHYYVPLTYSIEGEPFHDFIDLDLESDIDEARALISSLKADDLIQDQPINLLYMENGPDVKTAQLLANAIGRNLDITVETKAMSWPDLFDVALNGQYDMIMFGWTADYPHPMTFLSGFLEGGILSKVTRWHDPKVDQSIAQYMSNSRVDSLQQLQSIEKVILSGHHILPIYHRKELFIIHPDIQGWYRNTSSQFIFKEAGWKQ